MYRNYFLQINLFSKIIEQMGFQLSRATTWWPMQQNHAPRGHVRQMCCHQPAESVGKGTFTQIDEDRADRE